MIAVSLFARHILFAVNITLLTIIFVYFNISNANCGIGELSNFSTFLTKFANQTILPSPMRQRDSGVHTMPSRRPEPALASAVDLS